MGLIDKIKKDIQKTGHNKGKFMFFRESEKHRIRFLTDMDEGMEVTFHDSFEREINAPCQEHFGKSCEFCDDDTLRTRQLYLWSVFDYEANEVKILMSAVNNCTPVPALLAMYENYGTIIDRDYVISFTGKQTNKSFSVVPMDKVKFRGEKHKPFSESAILKILNKAYPQDEEDEEDDDNEVKNKPNKALSKKTKKPDIEDEEIDDDSFEDEIDYSEMSAKELYRECNKRNIEVLPKKTEKYYIRQLEEYDNAQGDWGDDDEWEDED